MTVTSAIEGFISFRGHQVWYRIVKPGQEDSNKLPLLCLHGGPGVPHDYLEPLEETERFLQVLGEFLNRVETQGYFSLDINRLAPLAS